MLFRHAVDEFMLTAAEPNLSYLQARALGKRVEIVDVSEEYAVLAAPGPPFPRHPRAARPRDRELSYFGLTPAKVAGHPVTISRTGFTGDLGYELMIDAADALDGPRRDHRGRCAARRCGPSARRRSTWPGSRPGCP